MSTPTNVHTLPERIEAHLADLDKQRLALLARGTDFHSVDRLAAAARQGARIEGQRIVISEAVRYVRYCAEAGDIDIERLLWAALEGASMEPYTSGIDAAEYASGQRNGLAWVRRNVVPREYDR